MLKLIVTEADRVKCEDCFQESLSETDFGTWKHCDLEGPGRCCDCGAVKDMEVVECFECEEYFTPEDSQEIACPRCKHLYQMNGNE